MSRPLPSSGLTEKLTGKFRIKESIFHVLGLRCLCGLRSPNADGFVRICPPFDEIDPLTVAGPASCFIKAVATNTAENKHF